MRTPRVTRTFHTTCGAVMRGMVDRPDGVTFLALPVDPKQTRWSVQGEFPHAEMVLLEDQCRARLLMVVNSGRVDEFSLDPECTRLFEHDGLHVAHIGIGRPVAAWTDEVS